MQVWECAGVQVLMYKSVYMYVYSCASLKFTYRYALCSNVYTLHCIYVLCIYVSVKYICVCLYMCISCLMEKAIMILIVTVLFFKLILEF